MIWAFKVMEELSPVIYHLNLPLTWNIHNTFYASLLMLHHETAEYGLKSPLPIPELIEREPEWEVEDILAS
jgi:hypothetical protein